MQFQKYKFFPLKLYPDFFNIIFLMKND